MGPGVLEKMVKSSAYKSIHVSGCAYGIGMLCMKRLKRVGESIDLFGTPMERRLFVNDVPLWMWIV